MNLHGDANIRVGVLIRYTRCSNREFAHDTLAYIASQKIPSIKEVSVRAIREFGNSKLPVRSQGQVAHCKVKWPIATVFVYVRKRNIHLTARRTCITPAQTLYVPMACVRP